MSGNVLWTQIFNKPDSQSQELTRQRIIQEERCGRRAPGVIPGPVYDELVRGRGAPLPDPWVSKGARHSIHPPIVGYSGTIPSLRPEHTGVNNGEQAAKFTQHFGTASYAKARNMAPGGGASALGTAPMPIPGTRAPVGRGLYDSLLVARAADPMNNP
jgi:hypothetical protein